MDSCGKVSRKKTNSAFVTQNSGFMTQNWILDKKESLVDDVGKNCTICFLKIILRLEYETVKITISAFHND